MNRSLTIAAGAAGWLLIVAVAVAGLSRNAKMSMSRLTTTSTACWVDRAETTTLWGPSSGLRVHDPVFQLGSDDRWRQVGSVRSVDAGRDQVTLSWYGDRPASGFKFQSHFQTGRLDEVFATLLPAEKRRRISQKLSRLIQQHGREMAATMMPLFEESMRESLPVIQSAMQRSISRHRCQIDLLAGQWNQQIVGQQLVPLAKQEVFPIVRKHAQPVIQQVGRELWDQASLWRFGWRALYDKSPLPDQDLLQGEWDRFVQEQAIPVLEDHTDQFVEALQDSMRDIAASPRVRGELRDVATQVAGDRSSQALLTTILRETLIDNPDLHDVWRSVWKSPKAKLALETIGDQVEPVLREIGDELFGSRDTGIVADFARVLRSQILGKDRRFIVALPAGGDQVTATKPIPTIQLATDAIPYPLVYLADPKPADDN